jgi:hypothetical protein
VKVRSVFQKAFPLVLRGQSELNLAIELELGFEAARGLEFLVAD